MQHLCRGPPDEAAYYEFLCKESGIQVHYCAEEFANDGSLASTILKNMKRVMAGEYSRELSTKVSVAHCSNFARLVAETAAWEKRRNAERARVKWMFTTEKARAKMARAYPKPSVKSGQVQRVKTSVSRY
jgi:hypothetical protein